MSNDNCGAIPHVPLRKPSAVDVTIGARVRLRRRMVGLTQKAFGDMTSISPQQVHKYENGMSTMSGARIAQFAKALKVPPSYFFEDLGFVDELPSELLTFLSRPETAQMIVTFSRIKEPATRKLIVDMVQKLAMADAAPSSPSVDEFSSVKAAASSSEPTAVRTGAPVSSLAQLAPISK